jgi:hypothetical protein
MEACQQPTKDPARKQPTQATAIHQPGYRSEMSVEPATIRGMLPYPMGSGIGLRYTARRYSTPHCSSKAAQSPRSLAPAHSADRRGNSRHSSPRILPLSRSGRDRRPHQPDSSARAAADARARATRFAGIAGLLQRAAGVRQHTLAMSTEQVTATFAAAQAGQVVRQTADRSVRQFGLAATDDTVRFVSAHRTAAGHRRTTPMRAFAADEPGRLTTLAVLAAGAATALTLVLTARGARRNTVDLVVGIDALLGGDEA